MTCVPALGTLLALILAIQRGGVEPVAIWLFGGLYFTSAAGVELGFHRYFSHRSFKCGPIMRGILGAFGSMAGQGPVLYWAATHREHHRFTDTDQDPHTPRPGGLKGLWRAHVGWLFLHRPVDMGRTVPDLLRDPTTLQVQRSYLAWFSLGLILPAIVGFVFAGARGALEGFLWGGLVRIFVNHHVTWSVNSLCHWVGTKPHPTDDDSRNLWILAIPSLGGAWHNNHHACPASATNDFQIWQLDPGAWLIRMAGRLGLVWDIREPPQRFRERAAP